MRRARYLGFMFDENSTLSLEPMGGHKPGDIFNVFPNKNPRQFPDKFPWCDCEYQTPGTEYCKFRTAELEFIPEKEFDPNDYL